MESLININNLCHKKEEFNVIVTKKGDYQSIETEFFWKFKPQLSMMHNTDQLGIRRHNNYPNI
jgi:hypothetical protein